MRLSQTRLPHFVQHEFWKCSQVCTEHRDWLRLCDTPKMMKNFCHIIWVADDETWFSCVNVETKQQKKQWMQHIHQTSRKVWTNACLAESWWHFLSMTAWESNAGGEIHATRDCSNITSALWNTKRKLCRAVQNKRYGMLTFGVVLQMIMHVHIQLLALKHCSSILFGSNLTTIFTDLIPLQGTCTCLSSWRTGWNHNISTIMRSWWEVSKLMWDLTGVRHLWHRHTETYSPIWQVPQFLGWLHWEVT